MTPTVPEIRAALVKVAAQPFWSAWEPGASRALDATRDLLARIPADAVLVTPESLARALRAMSGRYDAWPEWADKYAAASDAPSYPDGYAEPQRNPRYPQRFAEIMAGRVPLAPAEQVMPEDLSLTLVGPATAREIGWSKRQ